MPVKVDGSMGSLVQGMSQQPSRARLPGQSELQTNVTNDEVFGMSRRASLEYTGKSNRFPADAAGEFHSEHGNFRMGNTNMRYALRVCNGVDAPAITLTKGAMSYNVMLDASAQTYLKTDKASNPYGRRVLFKEMDGRVFVVNTQVKTAKLTGAPNYGNKRSTVVYCRGGKYANGYTINFQSGATNHQVTWATPDGSVSAHTEQAHARYIIKQLHDICTVDPLLPRDGSTAAQSQIQTANDRTWVAEPGKYYSSNNAKIWLTTNFDIRMVGAHLMFTPKAAFTADYLITATEASSSELLVDIRDDIKNVGRLPIRAPNGMVVRVVGSNRAEDDYFLKWVVKGLGVGTIRDVKGVWEECTAPDQAYRLDPATMPHELTFDGTDYKVSQNIWPERGAGTDDSNPFPKFVGEEILDVADFQGRATFLHGANVSMSQSDEYLTWFKQTATTKLATDPINLRSTSTQGDSKLVYAVPFNRDLVIFGTNHAQFMISGRQALNTDNASMVLTSEFETDLTTRPQALGDSIMFTSWSGKYTLVHEMYLDGDQNNHARRTVTDHVPRLLPGRARIFSANDGANTAMVVTDADPKKVYVYEFLWVDRSRVQSAWSEWMFDADIRSVRIDDGETSMTLRTKSGGFMSGKLPMFRKDAENLNFPLHMDHMQKVNLTDQDTFVMQCSGNVDTMTSKIVLSLDTVEGVSIAGMPLNVESVTPVVGASGEPNQVTVKLKRKHTGNVLCGTRFKTRFIPTMPVIRDGDGVAVTQAELTVEEFDITCDTTGPFDMIRQCSYERPEDYWKLHHSGLILGDPDFKLGTPPIDSTVVGFPFSDLTTTSKLVIECDTHLPMTLTEIEWRGTVKNRYRRITNGG